MSNGILSVKTFGGGSDWGYRVVNGGDQTMVTRRGYATETLARSAGRAAASVFAPPRMSLRYTSDETEMTPARMAKLQLPKRSFWKSLFG